MFISPENPVPQSHPVDAVFALLSDNRPGPQMPCEHGSIELKPPQPSAPPSLDTIEPPHGSLDNQDLRTAYEWLESECSTRRIHARQFDKVQKQHQELMAVHFQHEQEAALQAQEINREIQRLAAYSESLDERAKKLDERNDELTNLEGKLSGLQEEFETANACTRPLFMMSRPARPCGGFECPGSPACTSRKKPPAAKWRIGKPRSPKNVPRGNKRRRRSAKASRD